ncbi:glycosyltransferase [Psychrobium sp. 1_MG-2023]|uniref:glycosyltransferase n=1 Tax=Psychrobium sp. 1_MG-2023 TaxID=3062624 RepID=UPI000C34602E|nr:glycosyltransferase [Psychrobium sp. 1_MG-2023]MDP2559547.1 glycosyltransferase [Psychrobium sp. 1_MG-2023]PKF59386.1 hypothetical protein CW748_01015 [Alteromonadales bacterium alter-6D02]
MEDKSVLYVAFHYPPILGSSGMLRSLVFTRYLAHQGWDVRVLSVSLTAYEKWSQQQKDLVPSQVKVIRSFARDAAKSFSFRGKYLSWLALPDNWQSWIIGGVVSGLREIRRHKPKVIVSTYPIATAHIIAYILHRLTNVPWVIDLRDPMAQVDYPTNPIKKRIFQWIERVAVKHGRCLVVTTEGTRKLYQARFPQCDDDFFKVISNGYDEEIFRSLAVPPVKISNGGNDDAADPEQPITLLHSGVIYPSERDPTHLFQAIATLKKQQKIDASELRIKLRAAGHCAEFKPLIKQLDIEDIITFSPIVPYKEALEEMFSVDGLLVLQAANCNYQIPAKVYEYLKVQKPILGLMPQEGDTGQLLKGQNYPRVIPLDDTELIAQGLMAFINDIKTQNFNIPAAPAQLSRQYQAAKFCELLKEIT